MRPSVRSRLSVIAILALSALPAAAIAAVGDGFWHTDGNRLRDAAGNEVRFSGVNWHGMDSTNLIPHRLWGGTNHTIEKHLDEMKSVGFNLIRLPFSSEIFLPGQKPLQSAIDPVVNADLLGLTCLQILDRIVAAAGARGIRIILDYHRMTAGSSPEAGLWYDAGHPDSQWIANWTSLATRYRDDPTVVGCDLFNEVHGAVTWNADNVDTATNWRWAAKRCGNAILAINPHLLICVQGVDEYHGEAGWWGAVHLGDHDFPLTLAVADQLLYEVHDYGPVVFDQTFDQVANFPGNLPGFWDHQWGFLANDGTGPIWVGEWGSYLDQAAIVASAPGDTTMASRGQREVTGWFPTLRDYISGKHLSWTWWCWTNDSHDTGGILKEDNTVNSAKVSALATLMYPAFAPSTASSGGGGGAAPAITSALSATATVGQPFSYAITASGTAPLSFSTGALPSGLHLTGATISGTPDAGAANTWRIAITASNAAGSDTETLVLDVAAGAGAGGATATNSSSGSGRHCGLGAAVAALALALSGAWRRRQG